LRVSPENRHAYGQPHGVEISHRNVIHASKTEGVAMRYELLGLDDDHQTHVADRDARRADDRLGRPLRRLGNNFGILVSLGVRRLWNRLRA
jgi:hypothetical protein